MKTLNLPLLPKNTSLEKALDRLVISGRSGVLYKENRQLRLIHADEIISYLANSQKSRGREPVSLSNIESFVALPDISPRHKRELSSTQRINPAESEGLASTLWEHGQSLVVVFQSPGAARVYCRVEASIMHYSSPPQFCACDDVNDPCIVKKGTPHRKLCRHQRLYSCKCSKIDN